MDAVVLRTEDGLNELEVVKVGTKTECLAYLADTLFIPFDTIRNLKRLEYDNGRMFSVEQKIFGQVVGGEWKKFKYIYMNVP